MIRIIFITGIILAFYFMGFSQQLTPEVYLQRVMKYNQDIKISRENTSAALSAIMSMRTNKLPFVNLDANAQYQFSPAPLGTFKSKGESWNATLSVVQNVYGGNSVSNQLNVLKLNHAIAQLAENAIDENIAYAAFLNYWNTSAMNEMQVLSNEYLKLVSELHAVVEIRFNDGYIGKTDLLMLETRMAEAELQVSRANASFLLAKQQLNMLMGMPVDSVYELVSINTELSIPQIAPLEKALISRPEYLIAEQQIEMAAYQTKLVKSRYRPSMNVGLQESWGTSFLNIDNSTKFNTIAFANLNVPVFHWNSRKHDLAQTKVVEQVYALEKSKVIDQVSLELNNALTNLQETTKQLQILEKSLSIATENLILNTMSYSEGRLPILDVLSSQLSWLQSRTNLVSSKLNNKIAFADYLKATGMIVQ
ncbi:MAG: TolC family protein [Bacteroidetes bacterium]|nr:TolC family protein [Bacteroidota bacterium]